jgi:outer membrane protein OmpA-like peptidoglycan-associated protein
VACGAQGFGWRDADGRWSTVALEELPQQTGRWVRVEFDGAYSGTDRAAAGAVHVAGRRFAVSLLEGAFSKAAYIDAPPAAASSGEAPPIREPSVTGVLVFDPPAAGGAGGPEHPGGPFQVTLKDFRLHDWRHVSEETPIGRAVGTHGRLKGIGYGRLDLELEPTKRRKPPRVPGAAPPVTTQLRQRVDAAAGRVASRVQSALPPPLRPDPDAARDCPVCGRGWILLIALLFWLACSWRAGLVAGLTLWLACAIHEWLCRRGIGFHGMRRPWRTIINLVLGLALVWSALFALQKALAAAPLAACGSWFFPGYWQFLVLLVLCGLLPARWPRWVVTALFLWALLASCTAAGKSCGAPSLQSAPGAAAMSGSLPPGSLPPGLAPPATGAMPTAEGMPAAPAAAAPSVPPAAATGLSLPQQLAGSLSSIVGGLTSGVTALARPDETAELLQGLPSGAGGGITLASVSQARRDPDRYLQCFPESSGRSGPMHSIYLGYDAFFDLDSDRLKPAAAEASLRELLEVFTARPGARFVVTGHADSTGNDVYNLALSRRRAQAVADWLVQRGVAASRIEVVGAGSSVPLIRPDAALDEGGYLSTAVQTVLPQQFVNRINRRVEVAVDCPPPTARAR